jgi:hypothetical protein
MPFSFVEPRVSTSLHWAFEDSNSPHIMSFFYQSRVWEDIYGLILTNVSDCVTWRERLGDCGRADYSEKFTSVLA